MRTVLNPIKSVPHGEERFGEAESASRTTHALDATEFLTQPRSAIRTIVCACILQLRIASKLVLCAICSESAE